MLVFFLLIALTRKYILLTHLHFLYRMVIYKGEDMKTSKCVSCGANIEAYKQANTYKCPYCDTVYSPETISHTTTSNFAQSSSFSQANQFSQNSANNIGKIPKRPKANFFLLLILFSCGFLPVIIYLCIVSARQRKWDEQYS